MLVVRGLAENKSKAQALILAGLVVVNEHCVDKKGAPVKETDVIRLKATARFVSRGGEKLEAALETFAADVRDRVCIDIGASTGGFTDCLLKRGARFVHALDVGRAQIVQSLRTDKRVAVYEKLNARELDLHTFDPVPDIAVTDVSFISVTLIAPAVTRAFPGLKEWIILIKPQFEAEQNEVPRGGVIRDEVLRDTIVKRFTAKMALLNWRCDDIMQSPITGAKGNVEYLGIFRKS